MNLLRFGSAHREMVGFYHPPAQNVAQHPAVLICNPFGPEAIRSYRMLRLFADRLARTGCPVLRFDYFGTGDSPGEDEAASLIGWAGDIGSAHRELMTRSGKSSVAWLGVRLGGSLAALAAQSSRAPLRNLVLWDPVFDGVGYLEFLASDLEHHGLGQPVKVDKGDRIEVMGFALPAGFKNELRGFQLSAITTLAVSRCTAILSAETDASRQWQTAMAATSLKTGSWVSNTDAGWNSDKAMNTGAVPADVLRTIESKLLEPA